MNRALVAVDDVLTLENIFNLLRANSTILGNAERLGKAELAIMSLKDHKDHVESRREVKRTQTVGNGQNTRKRRLDDSAEPLNAATENSVFGEWFQRFVPRWSKK